MTDRRWPAGGIDGVDPAWSRFVDVADAEGVERTWHLLDNQAPATRGTLLCVHGNPTWSFLWRRVLAEAPAGWRVVAPDQLGMGLSERLDRPRRFAERIADLSSLTRALDVTGPVVILAHDWGGPISLGWALEHPDQLAAVVLTNTGVHLPVGTMPPSLIRLARTRALRESVCVRTRAFVRGASALSRPSLPPSVRRGLEFPYTQAGDRRSVGDFVADIPVEPDHPSRAAFDEVAAGVAGLTVPALLVWGPRDPVFSENQLDQLVQRLPHADIQRYPRASHLVTEDAPEAATDIWAWLTRTLTPDADRSVDPGRADQSAPTPARLPWAALLDRAADTETAVAEIHDGEIHQTSFADLEARIRRTAAGLMDHGVQAGHRVVLLVPPGLELTVAIYACWRVGAVIVVADAGLGLRGLAHALRSARPDHIIGIVKALVALGPLNVPGSRIVAGAVPEPVADLLGWTGNLARLGQTLARPLPEPLPGDPEAAVLFTSGATGPAKGVVYRRSQLSAQIAQVRALCRLGLKDRIVAAFAPFALYGPALGVGAVVPDMNVTAPRTLTAAALADAVAAIEATVVFASPAALRNVIATAGSVSPEQAVALGRVRRVLSVGAPVGLGLLRELQEVLPGADLHTPYGMTEALPVSDVTRAELEAIGPGNGVCVGFPRPGVDVAISPLSDDGRAEGELTDQAGSTGEVCVRAAHVKDHYDRLWATQQRSARNPGWHRSGDVGHFDADGRLWIEGRMVHVVTTADGPVTPVGLEQRLETLPTVATAAVVGVGPAGTQQVVAVVVPTDPTRGPLAAPELAAAAREVAGRPLAAVLVTPKVPVDIRHNAKIDRARIAAWAEDILAGRRAGRL